MTSVGEIAGRAEDKRRAWLGLDRHDSGHSITNREMFSFAYREANLTMQLLDHLGPSPARTTLVHVKVLEKRDADVEGAWTRFVVAATEHGAGLKRRSDARRARPHPPPLHERAGASAVRDHREEKILLLMERCDAIELGVCVCAPAAAFSFESKGGSDFQRSVRGQKYAAANQGLTALRPRLRVHAWSVGSWDVAMCVAENERESKPRVVSTEVNGQGRFAPCC